MEIKQSSPERDLFYWLAVPTVVSAYLTFAMGAVFAATAIAAVLCLLPFCYRSRTWRIRIILLAAGAFAGIPAMELRNRERKALRSFISGRSEISSAVMEVKDSGCAPEADFLETPLYVIADIHLPERSFRARVRPVRRDMWPVAPGYGDIFRISGFAEDDYGAASLPVVAAESIEFISRGKGCTRTLLDLRDRIMDHATASFGGGTDADDARVITAALIFGCCQGIPYEIMENFVLTGTIHILSVSGLHMGVLAAVVLALFFWVPFRLRYFLVPLILLPYLIMTGMPVPAVRAWMMFSAWCWCRCLLVRVPAVRILVMTAAAAALTVPFQLLNMGFQYSFAVTAALLMLVPLLRGFHALVECHRVFLLPHRIVQKVSVRRDRIRHMIFDVPAAALTAFAAGLPLTLFYHGKAAFISAGANIVIAPLLPLVYITLLIAGILPFEWSGRLCARIVDLLPLATEAAKDIASVPCGFGRPGWLLCAAGTAGILLMLLPSYCGKMKKAGVFLYLFCWTGCLLKPLLLPPAVFVITPAYSVVPTVAACVPSVGGGDAVVAAAALDREGRQALENILFEYGITRIRHIAAVKTTVNPARQLRALAGEIPPDTLILPEKMRKSSTITAVVEESGAAVVFMPEPCAEICGIPLRIIPEVNRSTVFCGSTELVSLEGVSNKMQIKEFRIPESLLPPGLFCGVFTSVIEAEPHIRHYQHGIEYIKPEDDIR